MKPTSAARCRPAPRSRSCWASTAPHVRALLPELAQWEAAWTGLAHGDRIVHGDLRADNMVRDRHLGVTFVDWAHAITGLACIDAASLAHPQGRRPTLRPAVPPQEDSSMKAVHNHPVLADPALDDPVGQSLCGRHAPLARRIGKAATYLPDVTTFATVSPGSGPEAWEDLAALLGPGELADMFSSPADPPDGWAPVFSLDGYQMVHLGAREGSPVSEAATEPEAVVLGEADVRDMLALIARTSPGPFWPRTHELGTYLGIRVDGTLVAMAGERLRPPGWTEISAVCTAPEARGRGYAGRLVNALVTRIESRGERPFLHVARANTAALALYERLGFEVRTPVTFRGFRTP
ncbi:GNAT family N-acetyltransferase [Streptomyces clavifer]